MKYWLIAFFFAPNGDYMGKRVIAYENEVRCLQAMDYIRPPKKNWITQIECVSDDHYMGRKKDEGVDYD